MTTEINAAANYNYDDLPVINIVDDQYLLSYGEVETAILDYLRKTGDIEKDEIVLSTDLPIPLTDFDGQLYFSFGVETADV